MSHLQYFDYQGFGERARREAHVRQAVRVGNHIEIAGQGGWDRLTEEISLDRAVEINQAFANVEHTIQQAGGTGLDQVYRLRIFLLNWDEQSEAAVISNLPKWFPNHEPVLTLIGVSRLYGKMTIEIEAYAHLG